MDSRCPLPRTQSLSHRYDSFLQSQVEHERAENITGPRQRRSVLVHRDAPIHRHGHPRRTHQQTDQTQHPQLLPTHRLLSALVLQPRNQTPRIPHPNTKDHRSEKPQPLPRLQPLLKPRPTNAQRSQTSRPQRDREALSHKHERQIPRPGKSRLPSRSRQTIQSRRGLA